MKMPNASKREIVAFQRPAKALLVESSPLIQRAISLMLKRLGCELDGVTESKYAVEVFKGGYDLIFLDTESSKINPHEVLKNLRFCEENLGRRSIVVGLGSEASDIYKAQGFDDFYATPLSFKDLKNIVSKWIPNYFMPAQNERNFQLAVGF